MSTQFDTSNASAVCVIDKNAAAGATNWAATPPHHDHHQQQLVTHIAVHTPIHAPRGSSCESQSFPVYSNGSPQAGFHVPANAFSTVTSSNCATSTPYQRQICFEQGATTTVIEKSESAIDADSDNGGRNSSEFDGPKIKIETIDIAQMSSDEVGDHGLLLLDAQNATSQNDSGVTPISKINADCLTFYKQQLTTNGNQETHQQFNDENSSGNNDAERRAKALAGGIVAPQPLRGDTPIYSNQQAIESSGSESAIELSSENCDNKISNNNNNNSMVNNNTTGQRNNNIENNNNNTNSFANNNSAGQFYSLGKSGNRTFFRAPGLEAPDMSQMSAVDSSIRVCPVCSFSCKSTFHYNSHMNTHSDHQCTMCNYTSRTEGRLRKHMNESHTHAERIRAGLENAATNGTSTSPDITNSSGAPITDSSPSISTTMTSIVNMVNMAAAATTTVAGAGNATQDLLSISERKSHSAIGFTPQYSDAFSSLNLMKDVSPNKGALDQIKALTERANNPLSALNEFLGIPTAHNGNGLQNDSEKDVSGLRDLMDEDEEMDADMPTSSSGTHSQQRQSTQPVVRRSGRPKMYRCKQCQYVSTTKDERWAHSKTHIPLDKQLVCTHCGFVTEYKHHLEYHMRNHKGSKPFKCSKCAYTCVNKSMLNSHMKSHTPVYQYRCKDCTYQTKYCHSLKMHLEKYRHTRMPGTVEMDSDGEEKPISEGDPDDYGNMDVGESRGGEDSHQGEFSVVSSDEQQDEQQQQNQLPQQPQQQQQQNTAHSALNSMLLQPIVSSASLAQYSDQIQQYPSLRQLEQVNELLRAANSTTFTCRQCDYVTTSNDELLRHSVAHLFANQQQQAQQSASSLTSLYQNLAAVQQQTGSDVFIGQQQQSLTTVLGSTGSELLSGILQPDSSTKELAAQLQQELLRAQVVAQQQQQQQEEESRRQAVVAAMASLANGNLGNGAGATISNNVLTSALLGHVSSSATSTSASIEPETHSIAFPAHQQQPQQDQHSVRIFTPTNQMVSIIDNSSTVVEPTSTHFHSSTTTTSSFGFGNDDDELQLTHSLSPTGSSGRRGSIGSASTSGGESTSKTCSVSPGSEGHGGSRKQRKPSKTIKVDQISVKLRDNANPSKHHRFREQENDEHRSKLNGTVSKSSSSDYGGLQTRSNTNGSGSSEESNFSTLLAQLNQQNQMPHSCQHCMIAFRDRALYQIHLGYHGYDTPFKCNRCGHVSDSSLEFNLHLYQAKHD